MAPILSPIPWELLHLSTSQENLLVDIYTEFSRHKCCISAPMAKTAPTIKATAYVVSQHSFLYADPSGNSEKAPTKPD